MRQRTTPTSASMEFRLRRPRPPLLTNLACSSTIPTILHRKNASCSLASARLFGHSSFATAIAPMMRSFESSQHEKPIAASAPFTPKGGTHEKALRLHRREAESLRETAQEASHHPT